MVDVPIDVCKAIAENVALFKRPTVSNCEKCSRVVAVL